MANIIGKVLLEQFRVDAFIASGGMGSVYRVWDLKRNVPLAMKVLNVELSEDEHALKLFEREARALKKLAHPNIVSFYGMYKTPDFIFLLEQYIDGPSLREIIKSRNGQPIPLSETVIYLRAIASALGYAHSHGVVHCDIKPGNIMIDQAGNVYLTDFGIARHAESTTTTLASMGTAAYMAPEQIRGEAVGPATDVYAMGVLLFEMLTGQRPFKGTEVKGDTSGSTANERIRAAHLHAPVPLAHLIIPDIPAKVSAIIEKAMAKQREARYASMAEMFEELSRVSGYEISTIASRVALPANLVEGVAEPVQQPKRPKAFAWMIIPAVLLFIIVGFFISSGFGGSPTPPASRYIRSNPSNTVSSNDVQDPEEQPTVMILVEDTETPPPAPTKTRQAKKPTLQPKPTEFSCPSAPHPVRFEVNDSIRVCTREDRLAFRQLPGTNQDILLWLLPSADLTIIGGPRCANKIIWWRVKTQSGKLGWVMDGSDSKDEFYICKVQ